MKTINLVLIGVFLFLFIFTPTALLPFNVIHILGPAASLILFLKYRRLTMGVYLSPAIGGFVFFQILLLFYSFVLNFLQNGDYTFSYYPLMMVFEVIPVAILLSEAFVKKGITVEDFYHVILMLGGAQMVFILVSMLFPDFREWTVGASMTGGAEEAYELVKEYRVFGFGRGYTFALPLFLGGCVIIAYALAIYRSSVYFVFIPFFCIGIIVNARIALLSLVVAPLVLFFLKGGVYFFKKTIAFALLIASGFVAIQWIDSISTSGGVGGDSMLWLKFGLDEIEDFMNGQRTGNLAALTNEMWIFPPAFEMITGTGQNIFGRSQGSSDIGYVVNIYYGGFVFSFLLYFGYLFMAAKHKAAGLLDLSIVLSLFVFLFLVNFKGNVFRSNEIVNMVIMIIVFSEVSRRSILLSRERSSD